MCLKRNLSKKKYVGCHCHPLPLNLLFAWLSCLTLCSALNLCSETSMQAWWIFRSAYFFQVSGGHFSIPSHSKESFQKWDRDIASKASHSLLWITACSCLSVFIYIWLCFVPMINLFPIALLQKNHSTVLVTCSTILATQVLISKQHYRFKPVKEDIVWQNM